MPPCLSPHSIYEFGLYTCNYCSECCSSCSWCCWSRWLSLLNIQESSVIYSKVNIVRINKKIARTTSNIPGTKYLPHYTLHHLSRHQSTYNSLMVHMLRDRQGTVFLDTGNRQRTPLHIRNLGPSKAKRNC